MAVKTLSSGRPVYVVGIGLHPYQFPTDTPFIHLGLTAMRQALRDAGLRWADVDAAYVGSANIGMASGRVMARHLGATGIPFQTCENASASGSTAFRNACLEVAAGYCDVAMVVGVDKTGPHVRRAALFDGTPKFAEVAHVMAVQFALMAAEYMRRTGASREQLAAVAVKNHGNAAHNPNAQCRKARSLEQVLASPKVAGPFTVQQCCPRGEGGAAVLVVSEDGLKRHGIDRARAVRVLASASVSDLSNEDEAKSAEEISRRAAYQAYEQAGVGPEDIDLVELHEAFTVEELVYLEAMGICPEGQGGHFIASGGANIGGKVAVNASGGLLGMGHPIGPTGVGQIAELVCQLRGEAGERQHSAGRTALAHMIGLGQVGLVHILQV